MTKILEMSGWCYTVFMSAPAFDTLKFTRKLQAAGIPVEQADAQAEAINEALDSQLATKVDILELDRKIDDVASGLDKKIAAVDNKIDLVESHLKDTLRLHGWMLAAIFAAVVFPLLQQLF